MKEFYNSLDYQAETQRPISPPARAGPVNGPTRGREARPA
jgi:hypothetical protein